MKLFTDLESIPDQSPDAIENARQMVKAPANYKDPVKIENYKIEHGAIAYEKTNFDGVSGEICSIAWAVDDEEIVAITRGANPNEKYTEADLLLHFFNSIASHQKSGEGDHQRIEWIGFNIIEFDLRFIKHRALINRIRPPIFLPADAKHDNGHVYDCMKEWTGWKGYVSQDAICRAFGLPQKEGMTGADVWPAYQAGEFGKIKAYNMSDVETVRNIYKRMTWQD